MCSHNNREIVNAITHPLPPPSPFRSSPPRQRKPLWQLDGHFHCSVIGTCVTLRELRRICQKLKFHVGSNVSDYELHRGFVSLANEPCDATRLLNKHLNRKHKHAVDLVADRDSEEQLEDFWNTSLQQGEIAGPYWALVTHPWAPVKLLQHIYGEVHMLSHLAGASIRMDMHKRNQLAQHNKNLTRQLKATTACSQRRHADYLQAQQALTAQSAKTKTLETTLADAHSQLARVYQDPLAQRLQIEVDTLSTQLKEAQNRTGHVQTLLEQWQQTAEQAQCYIRELENRLMETRQERDALENILNRLAPADAFAPRQVPQPQLCASADLCGRCILYVGGRHSQCGQFRILVEHHNGRFLHHDGGREDSRQRLATILAQADAVLCPLDCVSHDAVNRVKRFCQSYTKPLVLLPRASLSAFARGLEQLTSA